MSKRILITGAGGFVGPHLIRELQKNAEHEIYASIYSPSSDISSLLPQDHIIPGNLTDYQYAESLISTSKPDVIYNLASISRVESTVRDTTHLITTNTLIAYNVLEAARIKSPNTRVLAICSGNVYGRVEGNETPIKETNPLRPLNAYAVSKISQEYLSLQYHHAYGTDVVVLRPFNHTGPGQLAEFVIPSFAKQFVNIKSGKQEATLKVGNLDTARDFTDVRDMVRAYVLAADKGENGEVYNIGSGRAYTIREVLAMLQKLSGISVEVQEDSSKIRRSDVPILVADPTKFNAITGWTPTTAFEQTLGDVLQYWKDQA